MPTSPATRARATFPTTAHALQKRLQGLQNAFVTKLNPSGTAVEYSTLLGGNDYDFGFGIAVNKQGDAYVTGTTYGIFSSTFPTTSNAYQTTSSGNGDAFVSKLSADGSALVYSTFLGGAGYDGGRGIALDTSGNAYVTGYTQSSAFPTTAGAAQTVLNGAEDAFVTKLSSDGSGLMYSTYLGGSGNDAGFMELPLVPMVMRMSPAFHSLLTFRLRRARSKQPTARAKSHS